MKLKTSSNPRRFFYLLIEKWERNILGTKPAINPIRSSTNPWKQHPVGTYGNPEGHCWPRPYMLRKPDRWALRRLREPESGNAAVHWPDVPRIFKYDCIFVDKKCAFRGKNSKKDLANPPLNADFCGIQLNLFMEI